MCILQRKFITVLSQGVLLVESGLERVWHHIMQIIGFIFLVMTEVAQAAGD